MPPLDAYSHNKKLWLIQQHGRYQNKPSSKLRLPEGLVWSQILQKFGTKKGDGYLGTARDVLHILNRTNRERLIEHSRFFYKSQLC